MDFAELRDTTMDPGRRSLLQVGVEQAALASYMAHDLNGALHSVPEKEVKALPHKGRPLQCVPGFLRLRSHIEPMPGPAGA